MKLGETIFGFVVVKISYSEELAAEVYELCHQKTGAQLLWLDRVDQNKTFCIAFKTIPEDDTGVFHILEHSVLGGSGKYPVKDPFAELLKSSMATFLNAMTYPDKTVYPVSSCNEVDFLNLVDVYLDAVFNPSIYSKPEIFWQEGWHYELLDENETPIYNGVVFNEMKGAMSALEHVVTFGMQKLLFPDNCYRFNYGGDPKHIPDLSYEQFLNTHQKYYHPGNARIILDGDLPIEKMLEKLESYLCQYEYQQADAVIPEQKYASSCAEVHYEIGSDEGTENRAQLALGMIAGAWAEKEKMYALQAICDMLAGSNEAPLKRAILDAGLGQDVTMQLMDDMAQPWISVQVRNTNPDQYSEIRQIVNAVLTDQANQGLDKELLSATLRQMEFHTLDVQEPRGVKLSTACLKSWLYDGDPLLYAENVRTFASLQEKVDTDYFCEVLREVLLDESRICELHVLPSTTLGVENQVREERRICMAAENWTTENVQNILAQNYSLVSWQQIVDTEEALATMPVLSLQDIDCEPFLTNTEVYEQDGVTILTHSGTSKDILYINLYFSLADLKLADFSKAAACSTMLGALPTKNYDVQTLQRKLKQHLGDWQFDVTAFTPKSDSKVCKPYFTARFSMLAEEFINALPLIREILLETDFSDADSIREILLQNEEMLRQNIIMNGHSIATMRACAHESSEDAVKEAAKGYTAYCWLKAGKNTEDFTAWAEDFKSHFYRNGLTIGITGECDAQAIAALFPAGEKHCQTVSYKVDFADKEAILIPAGISYAAMGGRLQEPSAYNGAWNVLSHILSYEYLWNKIRVQGGAYGTGFRAPMNGNGAFYSYRDPSPLNSQETYCGASEFIKALCRENSDLSRFVIGAVGRLEPLLSAKQKGIHADSNYFTETTADDLRRIRLEALHTKSDELLNLCSALDGLIQNSAICMIGAEDAMKDIDNIKMYTL